MTPLGSKLIKAVKHPGQALSFVWMRIKGVGVKLYCRLFVPNVTIGSGFKLMGHVSFRGPGRVLIGDNVSLAMRVTPWTYAPEAVITIGDGCYLNGTRFGCARAITIGPESILADCRILDTDFHSTNPDHRNEEAYVKSAPIEIGARSWITTGCMVLKGVSIGTGSTITPLSVVHTSIPARVIAGGNPAVVIRPV